MKLDSPQAPTSSPSLEPTASQDVRLKSVSKHYGSVVAVNRINLTVSGGSYCCLLGPSGCGKTSTLRMIAGHEEVTHGSIWVGPTQVSELPPAKRNTPMMIQDYAQIHHKTVWDNIEFGLKMRRIPEPERQQRVGEMLELIGLSHLKHRRPNALSGGQQQRVALARALVTRPQVLLLDEPLSALDESMRARMRRELRNLQRQFGITFIQVTHVQEEAFGLSDQIVVMDHGHIDQVGTSYEIFAAPASQFVATFIGDNNIFSGRVTAVDRAWIYLDVEGLGRIRCRGASAEVGMTAACCIRADQLQPGSSNSSQRNSLDTIVSFIEFTGYLTRVTLKASATGHEILYKLRTAEFNQLHIREGDPLTVEWDPEDCIFLPK